MGINLGPMTFPTKVTGCLPFSVTSSAGLRSYVIRVGFKYALAAEDESMIVKVLALTTAEPLNFDADRLEDADFDEIEKFVSAGLDSYITRNGNGVASVTVDYL